MEINNILVSTSREGYYSISFDIVGENVNVYLSIDNEEYQEIFTNQSTSSLNYGDILSTGGHTAKLKISNELEEIESDEFDIFIKPIPTLNNVKVEQSLSDGTFIISYTLSGYSEDKFSVSYQVDENPFVISIGDNIQIGNNIFNGDGLSLGIHTLRLTATLENENENYLLVSDDIEIEIKVLPKLENITYSGSTNGEYSINFNIVGDINHTYKVELQINDEDYITLLENVNNGNNTHVGTNMPRGINVCRLKVSDNRDAYISNTFNIIIKNILSIQNVVQTDSNSKGEYKITFELLGDDLFLSNVELKVDNDDYKTIMQSQTSGTKLYNGNGLSLGGHTAQLRVKDSVDTYVIHFNIEIVNKVPNLSIVLTSDENTNGNYILNYATKDVETELLTHYLSIGDGEYQQISVVKDENFFTYNGSGLTSGNYIGHIKVTDGLDEVISQVFNIIIPFDTSTIKEQLATAKVRYDDKYTQLVNCVNSIIVDGIFNSDLENPLMEKALENYKNAYSEFNRISQISIDSIGTNKVTDARASLEESIEGVSSAVNDLEGTMYGVFADGILSDAEKDTINKQLNLISKEKIDVDKDYEILYDNDDLVEPYRSALKGAYNNFISKHNNLVTIISDIVEKVTIVDETDRTNIDNAFEEWRNAISNYKEQSLKSIDAIAQKKADDSADVVNKRWADIILNPNTGIQSIVGSLQQKISGDGGIEERLNLAEQSITPEAITQTVKNVTYTKDQIDGISIGGRNLIPDSYINKTSFEYGFGERHIYNLEPNTEYTLSVRGYTTQKALDNGICLGVYLWDVGWMWDEHLEIKETTLTTKTKTFTTPEVISGGLVKIAFYSMDNSTDLNEDNLVMVLWAKLEKGNKATDWTSAQEDIEDSISKVEQTAEKITWIVESGEDASSMTLTKDALEIIAENIRINGDVIIDGTLDGDKIIADSITSDKINLRNLQVVNDDGVTTLSISSNGDVAEMKIKNLMIMAQDGEYQNLTSMINQSVSAVEMKFVESNGYNKIHNSSFRNDFEYWSLLSWNSVGQMASAGAKYNWEIREAGNEWALSNRNVLSVYAHNLTDNTTEGLGVGVDSEKIWGGTDWTFSCLLAWHRTTGVHMEILEYDSSGSRLSNFNTDLFTTDGMHSGGNDRNNWYRVNKKFTLKNSNCAYFIIRLYMSKWDGQQNTAYLFLAEPQVVLGHKDVAYTLSSDEFYSGLVRADMNGLTVHMSNGEGSQGYSRLAYDGLSIYDSKGNRRAWFGDGDSAYIQNLSVDSINCPQVIKNSTASGRPTNFYVKAGSSGNGTSTGDYAGSINTVLNYIKNTWGVYSYAQDLSIYISPGSYSEDVYIAGWIGSGMIRLTFDSGATLYGSIKIEECTMYTVIDGGKENYGWDANAGAIIEQRNEGRAIEFRNSNGLVRGFRSRAGGGYYSSTFVKVGRGSDVMVYYNDVVGYVSVVSVSNNGVARCVDNRGDATYVADGQVSTLLLYGAIPMLTTNTNIRNDWACHKEDKSGSQTNSVWIPKADEPEPTPPPPPPATWKWFSQTFIVSNLRSVPEGTGSVTSGIANCMAQGNWSSYKAHRGYGDLGNSPSSWCSGGRNFTITCTMHRKNSSHGYAGAVPHPVFIHTDGSSWDCGVTFARNDTKTFTFPPSIANAIANGSMKTLQIWAGRSTTQYSHYDSVSITITCEKQV